MKSVFYETKKLLQIMRKEATIVNKKSRNY